MRRRIRTPWPLFNNPILLMADSQSNAVWATGRRKCAVARIRLTSGSGKITVNGRAFESYFPTETLRTTAVEPMVLTGHNSRFDVLVNIKGGGPMGQSGAMRHGLARALILADAALRPVLKTGGFLRRDSRIRERKKYGQPGARKRFQYSKR